MMALTWVHKRTSNDFISPRLGFSVDFGCQLVDMDVMCKVATNTLSMLVDIWLDIRNDTFFVSHLCPFFCV